MSRRRSVFLIVPVFLCWPFVCRGDLSEPGPFSAGSATVTITRPDASTFTALFYYPSTTGGPGAPLDTAGGPYSAVTFGHGFLQQPSRYSGTLSHLATYGHLVIATTSHAGFVPNHSGFAGDMRLTLDYLTARGADPADPLFGLVNTERFGLFGHSMGAGAGLLAAADDPRVKAYAGLATAVTNPSPLPRMPQIAAAVALLSGDEDGIVNYTTATVPLYEAATAARLQTLITGGCHVGFQDDPFPIFGDRGSLSVDEQLAVTRAYLTSYFGLYLRDDQSLWRNIWGPEGLSKPGLPTKADPGVKLAADVPSRQAAAGHAAAFEVTVTNTGPSAGSFTLLAEDHAWETVLGNLETPTLAPAEEFHFRLEVAVPPEAAEGTRDTVLLSARSNQDGATRGYLRLETVAVPEPGVFLPAALWALTAAVCRQARRGVRIR